MLAESLAVLPSRDDSSSQNPSISRPNPNA
jgi:hypothetical protein